MSAIDNELEFNDEPGTFNFVAYKMDYEGFDYCFRCYADFEEIDDDEFHRLRKAYCDIADDLENYVLEKAQEDIDDNRFQQVASIIENEGFDYCLRDWSDFKNIKDTEFHQLRTEWLAAWESLETYVKDRTDPGYLDGLGSSEE